MLEPFLPSASMTHWGLGRWLFLGIKEKKIIQNKKLSSWKLKKLGSSSTDHLG